MNFELLGEKLNSEGSIKILKKLKFICLSYDKRFISQTLSCYEGDSNFEFYSNYQYGIKIPNDVKNYLDSLFSEIADNDDLIDIIDYDDAPDDVHYTTLEIGFNFGDDKFTIEQNLFYYETDYSSTQINLENYPEIIDTLKEIKKENDIARFEVSFNGSGDSGYIETGHSEHGTVDVPADLEDFLYSKIGSIVGGGWEINEGSQGTFYFDLNSNTIDFSYGLNNESSVSKKLYEVNLNL